jgi:deoxyribonuclease-4
VLNAPVELLGAHVSTAGGVAAAPARGRAIGATAIQLFTKTPNQWREPTIDAARVDAYRAALARTRIAAVVAHDSYLINLASPDPVLRARSELSFAAELERCRALGIPWVVSHPGNFIDDRRAGLERNARSYATGLGAVEGPGVLIEGTAGSGTALGSTFEELRELRAAIPEPFRTRVGFCLDTAHLHAAGYDVVGNVEGVLDRFDRIVGLEHLGCLHLNDSKARVGSRVDRHEWIGEGRIGPAAFRRIMRDPRLRPVMKIIETPKLDDPLRHDRRMLRRLRGYARRPGPLASSPMTGERPRKELDCTISG